MFRSLTRLVPLMGCVYLIGCSPAKPISAAFDIPVTFTPAASASLKAAGAQAVIEVLYTGQPTEAAKPIANESGLIEMGEDLATLDGTSQTAHITGNGFDPEHLGAIAGQKVTVNVRAYSDNTHLDALIKCTPISLSLDAAQAKPQAIRCDAA